jgi:hypothetical protein
MTMRLPQHQLLTSALCRSSIQNIHAPKFSRSRVDGDSVDSTQPFTKPVADIVQRGLSSRNALRWSHLDKRHVAFRCLCGGRAY